MKWEHHQWQPGMNYTLSTSMIFLFRAFSVSVARSPANIMRLIVTIKFRETTVFHKRSAHLYECVCRVMQHREIKANKSWRNILSFCFLRSICTICNSRLVQFHPLFFRSLASATFLSVARSLFSAALFTTYYYFIIFPMFGAKLNV